MMMERNETKGTLKIRKNSLEHIRDSATSLKLYKTLLLLFYFLASNRRGYNRKRVSIFAKNA